MLADPARNTAAGPDKQRPQLQPAIKLHRELQGLACDRCNAVRTEAVGVRPSSLLFLGVQRPDSAKFLCDTMEVSAPKKDSMMRLFRQSMSFKSSAPAGALATNARSRSSQGPAWGSFEGLNLNCSIVCKIVITCRVLRETLGGPRAGGVLWLS